MHSRHDARETTKLARQAWLASFEDQVDPDLLLTDAERARRAQHALRAHMQRLALASARARRKGGDAA
ncbi:MAG: hypothetical protein M3526_03800 [Actinomycetota bacterium]|nr:hypothetical protein [Actinomycetota bacterium]